jgi:hypothetical protein
MFSYLICRTLSRSGVERLPPAQIKSMLGGQILLSHHYILWARQQDPQSGKNRDENQENALTH